MATQVRDSARTSNAELYEHDYHLWAMLTAEVLRETHVSGISMKDVAEEILDMGKSERGQLESRLIVLIHHLLKWEAQPEYRAVAGENSWKRTIAEQRVSIRKLLKKSPSLRNVAAASLQELHSDAVEIASAETGLSEGAFPDKCVWSLETILDRSFYPSGPHQADVQTGSARE